MGYFDNALPQLRNERRQAQMQIGKLDSAISVLERLVGRNTPVLRGIRRGRMFSPAARECPQRRNQERKRLFTKHQNRIIVPDDRRYF